MKRTVVSIFLLPGMVIHELAHAVMCWATGVKIHEIKLFGFGDPPAYVRHARPKNYAKSVVITLAPVAVNTITVIAFGAYTRSILQSYSYSEIGSIYVYTLLAVWIGLSAGACLLPSSTDYQSLWTETKDRLYNPLIWPFLPIIASVYILVIFNRFRFVIVISVSLFVAGAVGSVHIDYVLSVIFEHLNTS